MDHSEQPPATAPAMPVLRHHRDSLLPAVAAALSLKSGEVHTLAGRKADAQPVHHPLIAEFLVSLPVEHRERFLGRSRDVRDAGRGSERGRETARL